MRIWIWFVVDFSYRLVAAARGYYTQYHIISLFLRWANALLCILFVLRLQSSITITSQAESTPANLVQRNIEREYRKNCTMELDLWMWSETQQNTYMKLAEWKHLSDCGRFVTILLPCSFFFSMLFAIFHKHSIYRMACCRIGYPCHTTSRVHFTRHPN